MNTSSPHEISQLLADWNGGDRGALEKLIPLVYEELRRLAHHYMSRERPDHTLQTTALIDETYIRLASQKDVHWQNRAHFFAVVAQVMRHILVDHARTRCAAKHGGNARRVSLEGAAVMSEERAAELVALDEALARLAAVFPRKRQVVELRYFGGLSIEDTAKVLGIAPVTVRREWDSAKAWLRKALAGYA